MKMFGVNRYVALSLIALTLGLWTWVTYRVVNYGHLKETVAQQKSTIDTANRASQAVAEAERRIATDQTTLDAELCRRGWMARCPCALWQKGRSHCFAGEDLAPCPSKGDILAGRLR